MRNIALTTLIIGAAGIAGNIEMGKSIVAPAVLVIASVAIIIAKVVKDEKDSIDRGYSSHDASRPSYLR